MSTHGNTRVVVGYEQQATGYELEAHQLPRRYIMRHVLLIQTNIKYTNALAKIQFEESFIVLHQNVRPVRLQSI